ncbi:MAG: twin-arginine translocase subunit TatC [Deltaproteobacteria bacterium]
MTENTAINLTGHLRELRKRLIISLIALGVGFVAAYYRSEELYALLLAPLRAHMPQGQGHVIFTGIIEPFYIYMKIGLLGGVLLASPVIFYQVWAFVAPGLQRSERAGFLLIVAASAVLFISGVAFAYFVVFPFGFQYLLSYATEDLKPYLSMSEYFSFATKMLLAFGLVFQLPLAMLVLARIGIVTAYQMLSWWRYALVLILVASAILTPTPDAFNQLLMAGPLLVLYGLGIILAKLFGRRKEAKAASEHIDNPQTLL